MCYESLTARMGRGLSIKGRKHKPEQIIKKLREADMMLATAKPIC